MSIQPVYAIILDSADNVAIAADTLEAGANVTVKTGDCMLNIALTQDIPFGHKFALIDIKKGEAIIKYGEVIGQAVEGIGKGEHAHVHNIEGRRGRGDSK